MTPKKLKVFKVDAQTGKAEQIEILDRLQDLYKQINCEHVEQVIIPINGRRCYAIICDEEAHMHDTTPPVTVFYEDATPMIYGTAIIARATAKGWASLNGAEIHAIQRRLAAPSAAPERLVYVAEF